MVKYISAKVVLLGEAGVGKTGLGWRLAHGEFREHSSTHGQQFWGLDQLKHTRSDGAECEAVLWDLAGQPDYRLIHTLFLDDANLALVLFNPAERRDPLRGVEYWLKALAKRRNRPCHIILVGARIDVGDPALTRDEIDEFCRDCGIKGGYIPTSAKKGDGLVELIEKIKDLIGWDSMPRTVTTTTFKRIKDYVRRLKENPEQAKVLIDLESLLRQIQATDSRRALSDEEMMAAIEHLITAGYVRMLRTSIGARLLLYAPDLLNNLAASFVLEARRNPKGLGALDEGRLLKGEYPFRELDGMEERDSQTLLDATTTLFLEHHLCFRETHGSETLLIFPELINQKMPRIDEPFESEDGVSYTVSGDVQNAYAALVVLLGYTNLFTRTHQWEDQARYVMGENEVCGFRRLRTGIEGEVEFVLYYARRLGPGPRASFQGNFEMFLTRRRVQVTRYRSVVCTNSKCGYRLGREEIIQLLRLRSENIFCSRCGTKISLAGVSEVITPGPIHPEQIIADLRTRYESALVTVKSLAQQKRTKQPICFVSYAWGERINEQWVEKTLARDLENAGIAILLDRWDNAAVGKNVSRFISQLENPETWVVVVGTPLYRKKYENKLSKTGSVVAAEVDLINLRLTTGTEQQKESVLPVLREGNEAESLPPLMRGRVYANFRREETYFRALFDLVLTVYGISFKVPAVAELRETLDPEAQSSLIGT